MKVVIAGTRTITDATKLAAAIYISNFTITEVVCGGAPGVDELGRLYAVAHNIPVKLFPANWKLYGQLAGPMRNTEMVEYAEAALFVWDGVSPGTRDCMAKAKHKGIPMFTYMVKPDESSTL